MSLAASVFAAYAIERLRFKGSRQLGLAIFLAYLVPPSILCNVCQRPFASVQAYAGHGCVASVGEKASAPPPPVGVPVGGGPECPDR